MARAPRAGAGGGAADGRDAVVCSRRGADDRNHPDHRAGQHARRAVLGAARCAGRRGAVSIPCDPGPDAAGARGECRRPDQRHDLSGRHVRVRDRGDIGNTTDRCAYLYVAGQPAGRSGTVAHVDAAGHGRCPLSAAGGGHRRRPALQPQHDGTAFADRVDVRPRDRHRRHSVRVRHLRFRHHCDRCWRRDSDQKLQHGDRAADLVRVHADTTGSDGLLALHHDDQADRWIGSVQFRCQWRRFARRNEPRCSRWRPVRHTGCAWSVSIRRDHHRLDAGHVGQGHAELPLHRERSSHADLAGSVAQHVSARAFLHTAEPQRRGTRTGAILTAVGRTAARLDAVAIRPAQRYAHLHHLRSDRVHRTGHLPERRVRTTHVSCECPCGGDHPVAAASSEGRRAVFADGADRRRHCALSRRIQGTRWPLGHGDDSRPGTAGRAVGFAGCRWQCRPRHAGHFHDQRHAHRHRQFSAEHAAP